MNAYHVQKLIALLKLKVTGHYKGEITTDKRPPIVEASRISEKTVDRLCNPRKPFDHPFSTDILDRLTTYLKVDTGWLHFCENNPDPFREDVPRQGKVPEQWQQKIQHQLHDELSKYRSLNEYLGRENEAPGFGQLKIVENTNFKITIKSELRKLYGSAVSIKEDPVFTGRKGKEYRLDFSLKQKGILTDQQLLIKCAFFEGEGLVTPDSIDYFFNQWNAIGLETGKYLVISNKNFDTEARAKMDFHDMALTRWLDSEKELEAVLKMRGSNSSESEKFFSLLPNSDEGAFGAKELKQMILKEYFNNTETRYTNHISLSLRETIDFLLSKQD